jgi:MarR family transcriptional regulator, organic hydroperoxide resistance regulator
MKSKAPEFDVMDTNDSPYYLVTRAALSMTAGLRKALAASGADRVRPAYLGVLMCLWKKESMDEALAKLGGIGGMKIAELGRCAGLEPSTMTGLIDRMERDGLVLREDDPDDRRAQIIRLTDAGSGARKEVHAAMDAALLEAFGGIGSGALEELKVVLRKVLVNTERGAVG